jgi:hypothetical protein
LPISLADGAYVVVTSRHLANLKLAVTKRKDVPLDASSDGNLRDVRSYVEEFLRAHPDLRARVGSTQASSAKFIKTMMTKSEGNFIYLHYVLAALAETGKELKADELPQGLEEYYRGHWEQMQLGDPLEFKRSYGPIVCLLAVAREPLSVHQLADFTGQDAVTVSHALEQWHEFLVPEPVDGTVHYHLYHLSFRDFLQRQVDLTSYDKLIVNYVLSVARGEPGK